MKQQNKWFVIMWQDEFELITDLSERSVYQAIKSFCGNGKLEVDLSLREIANRVTISFMTVQRYLPKLIEKGLIKITGTKKRVGGKVNVYRVYPPVTASVTGGYALSEKTQKSVTPREESVTEPGTKPLQSNKVNISNKESITKYGEKYEPLN